MENNDTLIRSLGVMTGTSCDAIDMALLETDGVNIIRSHGFKSIPFDPALAESLMQLGKSAKKIGMAVLRIPNTQEIITAYSDAVANAIKISFNPDDYDIASIHGQTIYHNPAAQETLQIIDADLITKIIGRPVIYDFRTADVLAGGQGAPFAPLYHKALLNKSMPQKNAIWVNIGGVANVSYYNHHTDIITGWDTGMGCGLTDFLAQKHFDMAYDKDGKLAAQGIIDTHRLEILCKHDYFHTPPPKSLDRNDFTIDLFDGLSPHDAIATATAFTAQTLLISDNFCDAKPNLRIISGGGAKNTTLMNMLSNGSSCPVIISDDAGHPHHAIEAECFAWLGVRSMNKLPLSAPSVTGAKSEVTGGKIAYPV